jgi:tetratricopeptide (TPR) repeat protein
VSSWTGADTLEALEHLMRLDFALSHRQPPEARRAVSTGSALLDPVRRWLSAKPGPPGPARLTPGEIDEYEVSGIEVATQVFRDCGERRTGGLRRHAVVGQLYEITELLEHSYPEDITRRLFRTVAELAALAGSMAHEEGLDTTAQNYFLLALHAARQAGAEALGGEILSRMAQQMVRLGYPRDALALIDCARQGSKDEASASVRSLFLLVEAWSYAHLGQVEDCHRAVGGAQEAFADSQPREDPPSLSFSAADMVGMAGQVYRVLSEHDPGQAVHAEPLIRQALALRDPDNARDRALDLINLAMTYLLEGDLDKACATAEEALVLVDELRLSAYVLAQVRTLRAQAERDGSPEAHSLATPAGRAAGER